MGKPLLKAAAVVIVGIGAVAVCFVGYKVNASRQYDQRVSYAETAVKKEKTTLKEIEEEIASLYSDKTQVFLKNGLKEADVTKTATKLDTVKVSADEFGINEKDLPENVKSVEEEKEKLNQKMDDVDLKFRIQENVNDLFTKPVSNWQTAKNDVIIKEKLAETSIGDVRERLKLIEDSKWKELVTQYLDYATAQVTRVTDIQKEIDKMLKDGKATDAATYDAYLNLVNSISQVRNEALKEKFEKSADTLSKQIGVGTSVESSDTWSETEDTTQYYEEDTQTDESTEYDTSTEDGSYY